MAEFKNFTYTTARKTLISLLKNEGTKDHCDMVNHIVLFKLKEFPEDQKKEVIAGLKEMLEGLQKKITTAKHGSIIPFEIYSQLS